MSKLEDLIAELCPNGVEYKPLGEISEYIRGITYNKSQEAKNGETGIKVLRANNITLQTNSLNFDDVKIVIKDVKVRRNQYLFANDILICAGSGSREHIGKVAFIKEDMDYTFGGFMGVIRTNKLLKSRFLFHILTSSIFSDHLNLALNTSTINNLSASVIEPLKIPLPPIAVQEEINRVLDIFKTLKTDIETTLKAELEARKKQYEYYRDSLLTFNTNYDKINREQTANSKQQTANSKQQTANSKQQTANSKH